MLLQLENTQGSVGHRASALPGTSCLIVLSLTVPSRYVLLKVKFCGHPGSNRFIVVGLGAIPSSSWMLLLVGAQRVSPEC